MTRGVKLDYSEADLRNAVEQSTSWRGVMRSLGYATTNGYLGMRLRRQAEELGLDLNRFPRKRSWPRAELAEAVRDSSNWGEVLTRLGAYPNAAQRARVEEEADRLGIDASHFPSRRIQNGEMPFTAKPTPTLLRHAADNLATAWFARRGYPVSRPTEPRPYDLIVEADRRLYRIQVKTTCSPSSRGKTLECVIGHIPKRDNHRIPYDPADVDFFFIIDMDDNYYLVPMADVRGAVSVSLSMLQHRKVEH